MISPTKLLKPNSMKHTNIFSTSTDTVSTSVPHSINFRTIHNHSSSLIPSRLLLPSTIDESSRRNFMALMLRAPFKILESPRREIFIGKNGPVRSSDPQIHVHKKDCYEQAHECFREIHIAGIVHDYVTVMAIVVVCVNMGAPGLGLCVCRLAMKKEFRINVRVFHLLINMCIRYGCIEIARKVFDGMTQRTLVLWNGFVQNEFVDEVLNFFYSMKKEGFEPTGVREWYSWHFSELVKIVNDSYLYSKVAKMCVKCLRLEVDITEGLLKRLVLVRCPDCASYLLPPRTWVTLQLESKGLLTLCLKRLQNNMNINKTKLEYHGAILEQSYLVKYVRQDRMWESCSKVTENPDQWVAAVQLRQHVSHPRNFFYLEQLILKHGASACGVRIKQMDHSIAFYFTSRNQGNKFVEFIGKVSPIRSRSDKHLVSHDVKRIYNYKYTFSVEISPICGEDLICLPPIAAETLGNTCPIVIYTKVTNSIALLDLHTLKFGFLDADQYWRTSCKSLLPSRQLVEYIDALKCIFKDDCWKFVHISKSFYKQWDPGKLCSNKVLQP